MNCIKWTPKAFKQLRKIKDQRTETVIYDAVGDLAGWPDCRNVKRLVNRQYRYRLRVGRFRVFFDVVDGSVTIITIQEVKKRDERTY